MDTIISKVDKPSQQKNKETQQKVQESEAHSFTHPGVP